jgi:hypothetical protein
LRAAADQAPTPAATAAAKVGNSSNAEKRPHLDSLSGQAQSAATLMDSLMSQGAQQAVRSRSLIRVQVSFCVLGW